jgi:aspartyl/asparaginyl beta-hydroxylase (cupin superfamily)
MDNFNNNLIKLVFVKTNFKKIESHASKEILEKINKGEGEKQLTQAEFEEYVINSGAKGSFMVYRSKHEEEELGIDEL